MGSLDDKGIKEAREMAEKFKFFTYVFAGESMGHVSVPQPLF